jgi:hypothetical protein
LTIATNNQTDGGAAAAPSRRVHTASTLRKMALAQAESTRLANISSANSSARPAARPRTPNSREGYLRWLRRLRDGKAGDARAATRLAPAP